MLLDDYVKIEAAAEELQYHPQTVRVLLKSGKLKGIKRGRHWFVLKSGMKEYIFDDSTNIK